MPSSLCQFDKMELKFSNNSIVLMPLRRYLLLYITTAAILMVGCTGNGTKHMPQERDTLYTEKAAMDVYGTQPERALEIIDSAEIVGNLTEERASLLRAKVFCLTCGEERLDTARQICEALLQSDFVKDAPENREPVLDLLVTISRKKQDNEQWLRWATEKANFCRQQGNKTEALRTEAEIGIILTHLGRQDEGMEKLDDVIRQLDGTRKFNENDACIIALKRKINVLQEQECYAEIIAPAKLIVEKMNDYEQHPDDFHDGTGRESAAADVPGYCAFYRSQAYGFLANAYANIGDRANARQNITLFEQSQYGQTIDSRKMIVSTWCKLGDYDKMLAVYDEMEQHMGTDTICFDYATILHDRAIASEARGHHAQAYDYMSRYAALSRSLNDSLQASEAHEYAARYHAQEQQLQIEREQAKNARKNIYICSFIIISLLAVIIAAILFHRYSEIKRRNRILAQQIAETIKLSEELRVKSEEFAAATGKTDPVNLDSLTDEQLYTHLDEVIVREQLFLDSACDRQMLTERFSLPKERIGNAFVRGGGHKNVSAYVNTLRLDYAAQMLTDRPDLDVSQVAQASGFSSHRYFSTCFKQRFGLSPTEYREARRKQSFL